jgi:serine O-acetyltransferase
VVLKEIPEYCTVVGIPGKIIKQRNQRTEDLNQVDLPDPIAVELDCLRRRIIALENQLDKIQEQGENRHEDI